MTLSLVVRDPATGDFGSVICSSSPAVGARCVRLQDGIGGVHSQNITDPRIGERVLDALATGATATEALDQVVTNDTAAPFRQVLIVDALGTIAVHSGDRALGVVATATGPGAVAAGNMLAHDGIPDMLVDTWLGTKGSVEERLLAALVAAIDHGGEAGPVHSAALTATSGKGWSTTDLRIDWSDDPVGALADLYCVWAPQRDDYVTRALDPANSPGFGVPGDDR